MKSSRRSRSATKLIWRKAPIRLGPCGEWSPGRDEVTVYIENGGDFRVDASAVKSVHDGKVLFDRRRLDSSLLDAIEHAHDREEPGL